MEQCTWETKPLGKPTPTPLLLYGTQKFNDLFSTAHEPYESSQHPPSYSSKISFNIILQAMPVYLNWFLFIRFSDQNFVFIYLVSHAFYILHPSNLPWFFTFIIHVLGERNKLCSSWLCGFLQLHITYFLSWVQVWSSARSSQVPSVLVFVLKTFTVCLCPWQIVFTIK